MSLRGATGVAAVAAIGNFLQGWDGGAIAGKEKLYKSPPHVHSFVSLHDLYSKFFVSFCFLLNLNFCLQALEMLNMQPRMQEAC